MDLALLELRRVQATTAAELMRWCPELSHHRRCDGGAKVDLGWSNVRQHRIAGCG